MLINKSSCLSKRIQGFTELLSVMTLTHVRFCSWEKTKSSKCISTVLLLQTFTSHVWHGLIPDLWPDVKTEDNTTRNRSIPHWGNGQRSPCPRQQKDHWFCSDCIDAVSVILNLQKKWWNCTCRKRSWSCDLLLLSVLHQSHLSFAHIDLFGFVFFTGTFMGRWKRRVAMHWNNKFLKAWAGFEISSSLEVAKPCMKVLSKVIN